MLKYIPAPLMPPLGGQRGEELLLSEIEYYSYCVAESPADASDEGDRSPSPPNAPKGDTEDFPSALPAYSLLDLPSGIQENSPPAYSLPDLPPRVFPAPHRGVFSAVLNLRRYRAYCKKFQWKFGRLRCILGYQDLGGLGGGMRWGDP